MVHLYERADNSQSLKDNWRPEGTDLPGEPVPSLFRQTTISSGKTARNNEH